MRNDLLHFINGGHVMSEGEEFATLFRVVSLAYLIAYGLINVNHFAIRIILSRESPNHFLAWVQTTLPLAA